MYTNELKINAHGCNTVEEFSSKLQKASEKHGTNFLLEYRVTKNEDGSFKVILNDSEKEENTEMNLCYDVLDWLHDEANYGNVSQFKDYVDNSNSEYKEEWSETLDEYLASRDTDVINNVLAFDPNNEETADPEWKDNVSSYVDMVCDLYDFLLS